MTSHDARRAGRAFRRPVGDLDDLVIVCGTTFWAGTRLLDQHLAEELTAYAPVSFVDPPTRPVEVPQPGSRGGRAAPASTGRARIWR